MNVNKCLKFMAITITETILTFDIICIVQPDK